jgi:hypothetical protein
LEKIFQVALGVAAWAAPVLARVAPARVEVRTDCAANKKTAGKKRF